MVSILGAYASNKESVAKTLSIHACPFCIEGSGRVGPGTSLGQIFKRKLPSKII